MSAIFISASPGVKASALSWLMGEGVSEGGDWGVCTPPTSQKGKGQGPGLPESRGLLPLSEGRPRPLLLAAGVRFDGGPVC